MKTSFNKTGLATILFSMVLAGCSSAPVEETTEIEDTSVQTGQVDTSGIDDTEVTTSADTVFYFDFDKALLKPNLALLCWSMRRHSIAALAACVLKAMPMSAVPVSTTWLWASVGPMR